MVDHVTSRYYSTAGKPEVCFGFSINKIDQKTFNYTLNFFVSDGRGGRKSIPDTKAMSSNSLQLVPDLGSYRLWISSGYFALMKIINDIILQDLTKNSNAKIDFGVIAQNYTTFKADTNGGLFAQILPLIIVLGYLSPLIVLVYRWVKEKV